MNDWKIKYYLKEGSALVGIYRGAETNSTDVARKLFDSDHSAFTPAIYSDNSLKGVLFVRKSDVIAFSVSMV